MQDLIREQGKWVAPLAAMNAEHDPTRVAYLCFAPLLSNVNDTKNGKRREMLARLSSILPASLAFAVVSTNGSA